MKHSKMAVPVSLSINEKQAIEQLEMRFKNILSTDLREDKTLFYRFLKAQDFDIDKADTFLHKHLAWRKAFQIDNILQTFQPKEVFEKCNPISFIGFDKEGDIVNYSASGKLSAREVLNAMKFNDLLKHHVWLIEKYLLHMKRKNEKTGSENFQGIYIFDLDQLTFSNLTSKAAADTFLHLINILQNNYPERLKLVYVINAPVYFPILFSILKTVMSNAMLQKVHVFSSDGWKDELLKKIDADVLPAFLGGNRTDPDGNPMCHTFISHCGPISPKYFLSPEDRTFKTKSRVEQVKIPHKSSFKVPVEVKKFGSVIQWEFEVKSKDIGFGLFFRELEDLEEILPIQRFITTDGTEDGSFRSQSTGMYIIVFDNSHSSFSSKEVYYSITVQEPK